MIPTHPFSSHTWNFPENHTSGAPCYTPHLPLSSKSLFAKRIRQTARPRIHYPPSAIHPYTSQTQSPQSDSQTTPPTLANLTQRIHPHLNYPSPRAQHQPYDRCTPSLPLPSLQNLRPPPYLPRHSAHDISVGLTLPRYGSEVGRAGGRTIGPSLLGGSPQYQSGTRRRRRRATGWRPTQPDGVVKSRWAWEVGGQGGRKGGGSG